MKISAVIITFNSEHTISNVLKSLDWIDEIIVVDSFSTDNTPEICKKFDVKFFQLKWQGYGTQKNMANEYASNDWILSVDSDEVVSDELRKSIMTFQDLDKKNVVVDVSRKVWYMGRWIKHSGWYPEFRPRIFDKRKVRWDNNDPHNELIIEGGYESQKLKGELFHYTYMDINDQVERLNHFSYIAAKDLMNSGVKPNLIKSINSAIWRFLKIYFLKAGFLDGAAGFTIGVMESYYVILRYFKHAEMNSSNKVTVD